jgi:hypothetical protein
MSNVPNFIYIGPDKSGSSWLFKMLESHPECFVPDCKDIYYFDKYYQRGEEWYLRFFKQADKNAKAIGEISHGYLYDLHAPKRIHSAFPDMKIIATLRNPVERSISHYFYLKSGGLVNSDLRSAVRERPGIIRSSLYHTPVKRYLNEFPREQLNFCFFELLRRDPREFAHSIFRFLGLAEVDNLDFTQHVRKARKPKNVKLARTIKLAAIKARDIGLTRLVGKIKNSALAEKLYTPLDDAEKAQISSDEKAWLLDHFLDDIDKLQDLMKLDLSHWKQIQVD